jgi:hypothetical protein
MTETNDSQPSADLPLWGRVELGLLAGEVALWDFEIAELEYPSPADNTARCDYLKQLVTAAQAGLLGDGCQYINRSPWSLGNMAYRDERFSSWRIPREVYRQWRATQSNPPTSFAIGCWFGTTASIEPASAVTVPVSGTGDSRNPAKMRQCVTDKARFLKVATWEGTQQATVNHHPEATYFKGRYEMDALLKWASEIDPRPKDKRGGRPRKS